MCLFNIAKQGKNAVMYFLKRQNKTKLQFIKGSNKRMHLIDRWLMLFFSVSKQRKPHTKNSLHTKQLVEGRRNSIRFRLDLTCQTVLERETYGGNRIAAAGQFYSITTLQCFIRNASITKHASYCINAHQRVPAAMPLYV